MIWIVEGGMNGEGGSIVAVCRTREAARAIAGREFAEWAYAEKTAAHTPDSDTYLGDQEWLTVLPYGLGD